MLSRHASLLAMVALRVLSGSVEILAAAYMLRAGSLRNAVRLNAALGLVGPTVLVAATLIGVVGLRTELNTTRLILLMAGVGLIVLATR
ncbi:MAG: DUF2619 domain-containing protein [Firmicutes bacterium]|nr:DUF2619 domain-containing protein [Bacillota bacterium]